jgi:hypothetical protein
LKDPSHIGHIPDILSAYPNAKFINIHRNPLESVGSFCSLTKNIRTAFSKNVNQAKIGRTVLDFWQHNLNKGITDRKILGPNQIVDIAYRDFISDPLGEIKKTYSILGFDVDIETENKIEQYLINQKSLKKQKHSYSLNDFGLTEKDVKNQFHDYMMNYDF